MQARQRQALAWGHTAVRLMLCLARRGASERVKWTTPAFAAAYTGPAPTAKMPAAARMAVASGTRVVGWGGGSRLAQLGATGAGGWRFVVSSLASAAMGMHQLVASEGCSC